MGSLSDIVIIIILVLLVFSSAFFAGSETGLMSINRYRLRHLVRMKNRSAIRVNTLLQRPDRLLGVLLIGNTTVNIIASVLMTMLAVRYFGDLGILLDTVGLTLVILIFGEVAPKTLAALHPQQTAFIVSWPLSFLLKILYPLVWLVNTVSNGVLRLFGVHFEKAKMEHLSPDELRTMLHEAGSRIPAQHQEMLLSILDLEKMKVNDVMVPRQDIECIDLEDDLDVIIRQLTTTQHTQLPLCQDGIDNVKGMLHIRSVVNLFSNGKLTRKNLLNAIRPAYFVPEGTPLHTQLLNFREGKRRIALVVDEYGDIQGLVSIEDILEEIVGDLDSTIAQQNDEIKPQPDGSFLVDGAVNLRELNRVMQWSFPVEGPKTLSGLIIEYLESIPNPGTCIRLDGYPIEVMEVKGNLVKFAKIYPALRIQEESEE